MFNFADMINAICHKCHTVMTLVTHLDGNKQMPDNKTLATQHCWLGCWKLGEGLQTGHGFWRIGYMHLLLTLQLCFCEFTQNVYL